MKSPSIDLFYNKIERSIRLAQAYTEIEELGTIIKSCRLKPVDYLVEKNPKITLHKHWVDEFGNSLKITKNKKIGIIYNDLSVNKLHRCTDLYYGLPLDKIAKISKLAYFQMGQEEDFFQNCYFVTFLGIDNYYRSYMYLYGEWQQVSPLLLGINNLKLIQQYADIKYFIKFVNKKNMPIPCISGRAWLTFLPSSRDFLEEIKQYETIYSIVVKKENTTHDGT